VDGEEKIREAVGESEIEDKSSWTEDSQQGAGGIGRIP